jgi:hypothetical protein
MSITVNLRDAVVGTIHDTLAVTVTISSSCMRSWMDSVAKIKKCDI